MSKKLETIKKAVFYAHENPNPLAEIIAGNVSDVVTSVAISGADSIDVPTGDTANTAEYSAVAFSQFGDEMSGQTITFSLKASVTGVTLSTNTISVANTATAESFTIVATCGSKAAEKVVALIPANAD